MSLQNLEHRAAVKYFLELCAIPRGSGNEKEVSDFTADFGRKLGLDTIQDQANNVIIKKTGTTGFENAPRLILQAHLDMVCEKNKDVEHDFTKDPIQVYQDGDFLRARGTTLGADNGVGVAMAMAILESSELPHPPLTVIFTTEEEIGLFGAAALDAEHLDAARLINLDSGGDGVFTVGCAGGLRTVLTLSGRKEDLAGDYIGLKISIGGLLGGHSGGNINEGRANSVKLLGRFFAKIAENPAFIASLSGGDKENAIPREAEGIICIKSTDLPAITAALDILIADIKNEYVNSDPKIQISYAPVSDIASAFDRGTTNKIIAALRLLPSGVQNMDQNMPAYVETSLNLGVVAVRGGDITFGHAIRSSVTSRKYDLLSQLQEVAGLLNARLEFNGDYPAWPYRQNSPLRDVFVEAEKDLSGAEPRLVNVHGGLECGVFLEKNPGLDAIAIGADVQNPHSPDESFSIPSLQRVWKLLVEVLGRLRR